MPERDPVDELRRPRWRIGVGAALLAVLAMVAVAVVLGAAGGGRPTEVVSAPTPAAPAVESAPAVPLLVHVSGAVRTPGLYELPEGARLIDAIAAAGGVSEDADPAGINLARRVGDGEQVIVPKLGEVASGAVVGGEGSAGSSAAGPVSLNSASAAQLETLPRIGPAMAARIIEWRDAGGRFESVDDLLEVSGFGEKTVEGLRDLVVP